MSDPCSRFQPLLASHADEELAGADAADLRAHLAACAGCSSAVALHARVRNSILEARTPALAPEDLRAMLARAREPIVRWGQLAAAVLIAAIVPAALAVTAPRVSRPDTCACDIVTPALDSEL